MHCDIIMRDNIAQEMLRREEMLREKEAHLRAASSVAVSEAENYAKRLYEECQRELLEQLKWTVGADRKCLCRLACPLADGPLPLRLADQPGRLELALFDGLLFDAREDVQELCWSFSHRGVRASERFAALRASLAACRTDLALTLAAMLPAVCFPGQHCCFYSCDIEDHRRTLPELKELWSEFADACGWFSSPDM